MPTNRKKHRHNRKILPVIGGFIVGIILALGLFLLLNNWDLSKNTPALPIATTPTATPLNLTIDANAGALITPTPAPTVPGIAIAGVGAIKIPSGVLEAPTALHNPIDNEGWYYLTYELSLKDTGEIIFTTGLIPPGQYCNKVILNQKLEKGEYPAVLFVQPYMMDENLTPTNNANLDTMLIVD